MTLAEFRASMTLITPTQYENVYGHGIMDGAKQGDMVRCYDSGAWILYRAATGDHWMHLETEEYETAGDYDLKDMEETLYRWTHPEDQTDAATDSGQEPTPGPDSDHHERAEWAARIAKNNPAHAARLAACLMMQGADLDKGRPDPQQAQAFADEAGRDWTPGILAYAAEAHTRA